MLYFSFFFKKRKTPGDIIIMHLFTKNLDDMIYSSLDVECDGLKLVIMGHFLPLHTTPISPKNPKN